MYYKAKFLFGFLYIIKNLYTLELEECKVFIFYFQTSFPKKKDGKLFINISHKHLSQKHNLNIFKTRKIFSSQKKNISCKKSTLMYSSKKLKEYINDTCK